ncbi:sensory rhodopsin transducer [Antarcticibacterium sp. 1MA-6-2]|nr:sensory rhodopsin transducer [Antarcticibacterium sp. 1MA-6-2]UJH91726.1 sensory rhodopsin transducer [Antarcticibacterium sp. 1MA-6-2]
MKALGKKIWVIAEGYIPTYGTGKEPEFTSHETACILNTSDEKAEVEITIFFSDKDPVGPYKVTVEAQRTKHLRFNDLKDPELSASGNRLCLCYRIKYSCCSSAHQAGFKTGRKCAAFNYCVFRMSL